ncbi:MAG: SpoIID/LytB domain-containing protein [Oscillospiraceae bacterium]
MSVITKAGLLALAAVLLLPSAQTTQAAQPEPLIVIVQKRQDAQERTLRVLRDGSVEEVALDTYLAQVVLSEMPASFAPEALKAQAVAARTFACRQTAGGKHENADVCAQSACCQACLTVEDLRARYGDGFEAAWDKALAAVRETQNEVLTYEGALIDAVSFFLLRRLDGETRLLSGERTCRICGRSKAPGEQDAAKYESRVCVTAETFAETLRALDASAQLSGDPSGWVQSVTRTPGGGVDTLTAGDRSFSGVQLRKAFGLNSTRFTLLYEDGAFSFDVLGYGHRVGMSQYGADAIARLGFDYKTILRFYYRGASIESMQTNFKRQSRTGNAPSPQAGESA